MADPPAPDDKKTLASLPDRAARYKAEIERVVREVGEHPLCELKRSYSLSSLEERVEFVKDIQSIATSRIETEKFLVIGADDGSRSFHSVQNLDEFDDAKIRQLLEKYLRGIFSCCLSFPDSADGGFSQEPRLRVVPKASRNYYSEKGTYGRRDLPPARDWPSPKTGMKFTKRLWNWKRKNGHAKEQRIPSIWLLLVRKFA
jgi:hypothetical protein